MAEATLKDLQKRAAELDVDGRSSMNADELQAAIAAAEAEQAGSGGPPSPPDVVGRPELATLAEQRAAEREKTMRVIGSPTQED